ncbi:hypothetical protein MES4922_260085 [Mesorhizobium ventifaucium]|uniref:Transposase DDE domain-containing protein n=1 Tax=Mesorhizobium ventifaucium TaxID=666020 RepID=A0ABM9DVP7_9HYPH|nr:hypothetical protein MES4922_260085 [Mesorhizobium ventifaucium]
MLDECSIMDTLSLLHDWMTATRHPCTADGRTCMASRFSAPRTRLGTAGMSVVMNEADLPETTNGIVRAARGYESVRRDAETTKYFLWRPEVIMLRIWVFLGAVQSMGEALRPLDAKMPNVRVGNRKRALERR